MTRQRTAVKQTSRSSSRHSLVSRGGGCGGGGGGGGGGVEEEEEEGIKQTRERGGATPSVLLCDWLTEGKTQDTTYY